MAMVCRACTHDELEAIDRSLVSGAAVNAVATRYGLSEAAVRRHKANHLPSAIVVAQEAADVAQADDLLSRLQRLLERAEKRQDYADGLFARAVQAEDFRAGASALQAGSAATREVRACIELLLEVEGEISRRPEVNILVSPAFMRAAGVLLTALTPYPDARLAAAAALQQLEAISVARN